MPHSGGLKSMEDRLSIEGRKGFMAKAKGGAITSHEICIYIMHGRVVPDLQIIQ